MRWWGVAVLLACLSLPLHAWGTVFYVDSTPPGSAATNCTQAQNINTPHDTLAEGVACLAPGDTLNIRAGTYSTVMGNSLGIPSGTTSQPITIRGYQNENPIMNKIDLNTSSSGTYHDLIFSNMILDGTGRGSNDNGVFLGGANTYSITLQDMEIRDWQAMGVQSFRGRDHIFRRLNVHHNGNSTPPEKHGFYVAVLRGIIEDCVIHENYSYGIQVYDSTGTTDQADDFIIRNNVIWGNTLKGGITAGYGDNIRIYNNVIYTNQNTGIQVEYGSPDNAQVEFNTIYNNSGIGIVIGSQTTNIKIRSNIIIGGSAPIVNNGGTSPILASNVCASVNNAIGCARSGTASSLWTNAGANDFTLKSTSPAKDAAATTLTVTTDILGMPRPWPAGGSWDAGAYEFIGAADPPSVTISTPTAASTLSVTSATVSSVAGSATDPQGNGTITQVNWTCATCTPSSGTATGTFSWTFGPITLSTGANTISVTATDGTLTSTPDTLTITYTPPGSCTHYASPSGSGGTGCTNAGGPYCSLASWVNQPPSPGQTLCLVDGTYGGLSAPATFNGTSGNPITIKALNDGQVWLNGGSGRGISVLGSYGVVEGVNIRGGDNAVLAARFDSDHWTFKRIVVWSNNSTMVESAVDLSGTNVTLEDCAVFGYGRKIIAAGAGGGGRSSNTVIRRCWAQWSQNPNSTGSPHGIYDIGYDQSGVTVENSLSTYARLTPGEAHDYNPGISMFSTLGSKLLGLIAYQTASSDMPHSTAVGIWDTGGSHVGDTNTSNSIVQDLVTYISPQNAQFASKKGFSAAGPAGTNNQADNVVNIAGQGASCTGPWTCSNLKSGTSLTAALGSGVSVWDAVPGVCRRYVDGTLTTTPLWPWPMNQRILDAMTFAGVTTVDVTATMESLFGVIPQQCRTGTPTPVLNPPTNLQVTTFNSVVPRSATLAWTYTQGTQTATGFRLYSQPGCSGAFTQVGSDLPLSPTSVTHSSLPTVGQYCWQVTAIDGSGNESTVATASYTPTPDAPPPSLAEALGGGPAGLMPVSFGPQTPRLLLSQPVRRSHGLLTNLREAWRVLPHRFGGSTLYGLLGRIDLTGVNLPSATSSWGTTGRLGADGELQFNGAVAYFTSGTRYTGNGPFSVAVWAKASAAEHLDLIGQTNNNFSNVNGDGWGLWRAGSTAEAYCSKDNDNNHAPGISMPVGVWMHLGCTWDGTDLKFYANGQLVSTLTDTTAYQQGYPLTLGAMPTYTTSSWKGSVDAPFFFSQAISAATMQALYQEGRTGEQHLLQHWTLLPVFGPLSASRARGGAFFQR